MMGSCSFGIETANTFIHSRSSSKTISYSRPKWAKSIQFFKQGPAYKKEGPDLNKGSNQQ